MAANQREGFRIRVGEREHHVEIVALSDDPSAPVRVRVDGHELEVAEAGAHALRVAATTGDDHRQREITLATDPRSRGGRPTEAWLAGVRTRLEVQTEREARLAAALGQSAGGASSGSLVAPMPGRVVKVLVAVGDTVERGAPAVIVEAMKMENELHAPVSGVVRSVGVREGDTVDANQILVEIEAPAEQ